MPVFGDARMFTAKEVRTRREKRDFANSDDSWIEEVEAMRTICVLNGLDPLVERSRSGRGTGEFEILSIL